MIRRNPAEWRQLIEEHAHSKLNAIEFCKSKGIDPKYFSLKKAKFHHFEAATPFIEALAPVVTGPELSLSWAGADIHLPADTSLINLMWLVLWGS